MHKIKVTLLGLLLCLAISANSVRHVGAKY